MAETGPGAIARAMRARRIELGLSVEEAAAQARIHLTSWRLIEHGTVEPSPLVISVICRVLDWTPATIESLTLGELQIDAEGGVVVDLDRWPRQLAERAAAHERPTLAAAPARDLHVKGLTPDQLAQVQDFIDELRDRAIDDDAPDAG